MRLSLLQAPIANVRRMLKTRHRTAVTALALAGILGACGSDGGGSSEAGPASIDEEAAAENDGGGSGSGDGGGTVDNAELQDAAVEYAECMRGHGIEMPDPEVDENGQLRISAGNPSEGSGRGGEELQAAEEECRPILDEAMPEREPLDPEELAEREDQALALAECMRGRGHEFPDPEVSEEGGIQIQNPGDGVAPGDPGFEEYQADVQECHDEAGMPTPGDGGSLSSRSEA